LYWKAALGGKISVADQTELVFERETAEAGVQLPSWPSDPTSFITSPETVVADSLKVTEAPVETGAAVDELVVAGGTTVLPVADAVIALVLLIVELKVTTPSISACTVRGRRGTQRSRKV
jgi:hypothetical protein